MKPIALIILVLVVHSESFCTRTPYRKKRFGRIANEEIRSFIQRRVHNITDNDCAMTYNVTFDDEDTPFYPFLINRQDKQVFGVVQLNSTNGKYQWKKWDSKLFVRYYEWCHEKPENESDRFELPGPPTKPLPQNLTCQLNRFKM